MTDAAIKKPAHVACPGHRFSRDFVLRSARSIGSVEMWQCLNCLTVKVVQQKVGHTIEDPIETIVELADSAYPR